MTHTTRLYFEAHITVRPQPSQAAEMWPHFVKSAELNGWRASRFDIDEVDHYDGAWFMSAREVDYDEMLRMVQEQAALFKPHNGYEFIRAKIEDTLFDTKHGDVL